MDELIGEKKFLLKDKLFNKKKVEYLANLISVAWPQFEKGKFSKEVLASFPELELKERIFLIEKKLEKFLPKDFERAKEIILKSLPKELDDSRRDNDFGDYILSPFEYFVSERGCEKENLEASFFAISEITKRFTAESSIRFFINKFPKESFSFLKKMAMSKNYHQRRLASEGLRPKLPWCIGIDFDYKKSVDILNILYSDKTRYVVRSVANHLNDISKIDIDFVLEVLERWRLEGRQEEEEFDYLVKHTLRTAVKKGHQKSLEFLGFTISPKISIKSFCIKNKKIKIGEFLSFSFEVCSEERANLVVDYKIIYPSKSSRKSEKVFKIKKLKIEKGEYILVEKKHLFREMTTKKLYSGEHVLQVKINGKVFKEDIFYLDVKY